MSDTHAQTVAFVRDTMLPPEDPPSSQTGAVKWMRENLFSGWVSAVLTILSILAILWIAYELLPWLANSVWNANSLSECRAILDGASGACWAVIRVNWLQLIFGFYPPELYWRPILSFLLLLIAIAPVLFPSVPRQLLWFSAVFPFIGVWLLWGGSIWGPVTVLVGLAALGVFIMRASEPLGTVPAGILAVVLVLVLFFDPLGWVGISASPFPIAQNVAASLGAAIPAELESVPSREFGGFMISVVIGVAGIALSLPLGILFALGRQSNMPLIKWISVTFIEFIRGVPLITLLFTASLLLNYFLPPGTNFDLILRVIIMVTLFATAYMAEVIRGGLAALPRGQYEAADALGLDYWKAQRLIIMPQALKISIPGIVNTFIGLFKDTTLVVFIGILDPIGRASAIRATSDWQGIYWELFIFIGAVFWVFCFSMSRYSMHLERRLKTDHR
ncbi:MAG: amino acid ABC transporter permease [Rhodobacteraceae bacterium]|nr:amino acid ABC transporter permease [Paracoccaceae bacterium]